MMQFEASPEVLLATAFFNTIGFMGFPLIMRWVISLLHTVKGRLLRRDASSLWYIINNPRHCTTFIFPRKQTGLLFRFLLLVTVIEWVFILGFNWRGYLAELPVSNFAKVVITLFQAVCTRTTGFNALDLSQYNPGVLVLTCMLMYISSYPMTVVMRSTNVIQPVFVRVFSTSSGFLHHAKRLILYDILWVMVPFLLVCLIEADQLNNDPYFTHFRVIFEVVSGYANVGLSLGYPGEAASFCCKWSAASKVILLFVILFGHHRGFPDRLDQAVCPALNPETRNAAVYHRTCADTREDEGVITARPARGEDML
eukprot:TRINITY_DN2395_c2_g1_i2.p2 TRINITY_DN2395_c2_g1~~TRINITY_DN2395_c2_g1_i2.p2  ORF type:complete len:312 (+),score=83.26 TRINITY_DN2395_c2_g1_i2:1386-2321(+)